MMAKNKKPVKDEADRGAGTGALCPEAQADGVPCTELGRDCEVCEHAVRERKIAGRFGLDPGD